MGKIERIERKQKALISSSAGWLLDRGIPVPIQARFHDHMDMIHIIAAHGESILQEAYDVQKHDLAIATQLLVVAITGHVSERAMQEVKDEVRNGGIPHVQEAQKLFGKAKEARIKGVDAKVITEKFKREVEPIEAEINAHAKADKALRDLLNKRIGLERILSSGKIEEGSKKRNITLIERQEFQKELDRMPEVISKALQENRMTNDQLPSWLQKFHS